MSESLIRVLLVEDNPIEARLIRGLLDGEPELTFRLECVGRLQAAIEYLDGQPAQAVLLDLTLPDASGLDTFEHLRRCFPSMPIVILTGLEDELLAVKAIEGGAQDYLVKGHVDRHGLSRSLATPSNVNEPPRRSGNATRSWSIEWPSARAELTASNHELEAFCHSVAHDLRTPLRAIDGFTRSLERCAEVLDDRGRKDLHRVREAAQRMGQRSTPCLTCRG